MAGTRVTDQPVASVRDRVVQAAARLFAEKGFESTSVREIVEAAGVTKGGLYHYFDSKDALLSEIYSRMLRMQANRLETIAESGLPLPQRVHAIIADVVSTSIAHLDDAVVFFQSVHLLEAGKQAQVRAERRRYHERFRALVEEGQRTGVFLADVPADIVVNYHFGAIHRLGMWYRPSGSLTGEQVGLYFADLMLRSLLPSGPRPAGGVPGSVKASLTASDAHPSPATTLNGDTSRRWP